MTALIGNIYEAALDPSAWRFVWQGMGNLFEAGTGPVIYDPASGPTMTEVINFDPDFVRSYNEYYGRLNLWASRYGEFPIGTVLDRSIIPGLGLKSTEYYRDWLKPQGWGDTIGSILSKSGHRFSYVGAIRPARLGTFSAHDRQSFQIIVRNILLALRVHARLARVSALELLLFEALDRAGLAAFAVDEDRHLLENNALADALLRERTVLQLSLGILTARHPPADHELARGVVEACRARQGRTLMLPHIPSDEPPFVGLVMPIGNAASQTFLLGSAPERFALLLVKDPARSPRTEADVLRQLFDLTRAESRLLADLISGQSLEEISEQREVRYGTLRTQLRAIMFKTSTRRQGELIALATRHTALNVSPAGNGD